LALLGANPQAFVLLEVAKSSISLLNRIPVEGERTLDPHAVLTWDTQCKWERLGEIWGRVVVRTVEVKETALREGSIAEI